jgi:tripartite-type tricarboxylate transporter receptor subunit TctC
VKGKSFLQIIIEEETMKKILMCGWICLLVAGSLFAAGQQSNDREVTTGWKPTRPVNIICNSSAGGGTDLVSRTLAQALGQIMGQNFQVTNVTGGSGGIAMHQVWNGPHDGYTIMGMSEMIHTVAVAETFSHMSDIWDLFICCGSPGLVAVHADSPYKTFDDLLNAAKTKEIKVAASNPVSVWGVKFAQMAKIVGTAYKFNYLPYTGSAPSNVALLSNEVDMVVTAKAEQLQYIQGGQFRPLVALEPEDVEIEGFGTVKSLAKWYPEFANYPTVVQWLGIAVPGDVPKEVRDAYRDAFKKALETDVVKNMLKTTTFSLYGLIGDEANARAKLLDSSMSWAVYDTGLVKVSPEKYNVPKP